LLSRKGTPSRDYFGVVQKSRNPDSPRWKRREVRGGEFWGILYVSERGKKM